jgi:FkbM family methyltransferase
MRAPDLVPSAEMVRRIWAFVAANTSRMGDRFERMTQAFYSKIVRPGDTVIDGGAHTGRHTIPLALLVGQHGRVLAFEPLPVPAERLRGLLAGTSLQGRVELRPDALAHEPGRQSFFVVNNMPEYSGLRRREYVAFEPDHTEIEVAVTTIDAAIGDSLRPGAVSFVKLDLEGGEFRAFQGAVATLRVHRPCCVFENGLSSSATGYGASEFFGLFHQIGYEVYDIFGNRVTESQWEWPGPWQFIALPGERRTDLVPILTASAVLELLVDSPSFSTHQPAPEPFASSDRAVAPGVHGALDEIDCAIRVRGWAGDLTRGRPVRAIVITVDGEPVATLQPGMARHDVAAVMGQVDLALCGFEASVPIPVRHRVEVHAQTDDGLYVRIGESPAP